MSPENLDTSEKFFSAVGLFLFHSSIINNRPFRQAKENPAGKMGFL